MLNIEVDNVNLELEVNNEYLLLHLENRNFSALGMEPAMTDHAVQSVI